jgi:hypothetical protein
MSDEIIEALAAARPPQFRPGSAIDPVTRERELSASFSAPARSARRHRRDSRERPDRRPLAILAAALSVALIATGVWLVHPPSPRPRPSKVDASKHPSPRPAPAAVRNLLSAPVAKPPPVAQAQAGMPAYYVVADHNGPAIEVHSTTTGELLSEVTLPAGVDPKLCKITAGLGGRFVLALFALPRTTFYLLKVTDDGRSAQLTALSLPPVPEGEVVEALALSPDGAKLAVAIQIGSKSRGVIEIVTLATGARRTWTSAQAGFPIQLSWTDQGRHLGFYWSDDDPTSLANGLWRLDPTTPGSDPFSGRQVLPEMVGSDEVESAAFSPDGKTIDASVVHIILHKVHRREPIGGIVKLSAQTGRPLSTLLTQRAIHASKYGNRSYSQGDCDLIAADPAGNHLLVNCSSQFGRLDRGRFTPMTNPDPQVSLTVAW